MLQEIEAAVNFLTRLVAKSVDPGGPNNKSKSDSRSPSGKCLTEDKVQEFSRRLTTILQNRFRNHWFPERPTRGQGYRCIRINENCSIDKSIEKACQECGISYQALRLPVELTLWIDPNEVTCRFGEHKGSYCTVAKLSDGRQENYVNSINIEELEQQSLEHSKQSSFDIVHSRKKRQQAMLHQRAKNSPMALFNANSNSTTYHAHHQSMNGSLSNGASPAGHLGGNSSGHPHVPVTSTTQNMNGYVEYGPNGLLPTTSSGAVSMQQYHSHFGSQQPHFYPNSAPNPFQQHHVAVQHSSHFGSPTNHLFPKYNHLGLQSQQGPSQPGQMAGGRLNSASLASGTFRSNSNSVGAKQTVNMFASPSNAHHNASAAASPVIASLGASHHGTPNSGSSKSNNSTSIATSNANPSSFARGLQSAFNLAAVPFTPSTAVTVNGGISSPTVASSASNTNGYQWVNKSIVKA